MLVARVSLPSQLPASVDASASHDPGSCGEGGREVRGGEGGVRGCCSLLELALLPRVFLPPAPPGQEIVVHAALGQRDEQVGAVVTQVERDLGCRHLLLSHLHLCQGRGRRADRDNPRDR